MKQKLLIILLAASVPFIANAQFGNVLGKVKNKVNQRIDRKVDQAIDETLDKTEKEATSGEPSTSEKKQGGKEEEAAITSFSKYDFWSTEDSSFILLVLYSPG